MKKIGIIGDGQLARMLIQSTNPVYDKNIQFFVMPLKDPLESPCRDLNGVLFVRTYDELFQLCDVVTYEYENINVDYMLEKGYQTIPSLQCLQIIQNKFLQKKQYQDNGFNVPATLFYGSGRDILNYYSDIDKIPATTIIKRCIGGYDGRGVCKIDSLKTKSLLDKFIDLDVEYYVEECINNPIEVSVIVVVNGDVIHAYNPTLLYMHPDDNILLSYCSLISLFNLCFCYI